MTETPVLILMLKAPAPGRVKTRLAATVGTERATAIYRALVERQMGALPAGWPVEVHFDPPEAAAEMCAWLGETAAYFPQASGDLGTRLSVALWAATDRAARPVIFLGGDCPALDTPILEAAARELTAADVVLGPASDGGYYLIGLREAQAGLFEDIPWSTAEVLAVTLEKARTLGWRVALLPMLDDVDTKADWQRAAGRFGLTI